jgi:hypothetical protein
MPAEEASAILAESEAEPLAELTDTLEKKSHKAAAGE